MSARLRHSGSPLARSAAPVTRSPAMWRVDHLAEAREEVAGVVRARATPRGGTAPRRAAASACARPSTVPSFRFTWVISTGSPGRAQRVGVDREAVVLGADLDLAGREVLAGLVAAVVAELELVRLAAEREAEDLVAEADAEDGTCLGELAHVLAHALRPPPDRPGRSRGRPRRARARAPRAAVVVAGHHASRRSPARRAGAGCCA